MSRRDRVGLTCPKCHKESEFEIWESVNVQINPEIKEEVLNGNVFAFNCPNCGEKSFVHYSMLYHDMEKKMFIYMVPNDEEKIRECAEILSGKIDEGKTFVMEGYTNRIVNTITELQEKIKIADAGYDDRVIEIIKVIYMSMLKDENPNQNVDDLFFSPNKDGSYDIVFLYNGKAVAFAPLEDDFYRNVGEEFKERIENNLAENFIYDFSWAGSLFE